jgi:uncharacterized protein YbjT (DUF2867 family)
MFLVIGASGNVGREVTSQLLAAGQQVRILARSPARVSFPAAVEVVQGALEHPETLAAAMKGVSAVHSLMRPGTTGHLASAAAEAGVDRIVLITSLAAEWGDSPLSQSHRDAESAVSGSGVPWTFLRPTNFASNSLAWAPAVKASGTVRAPFGEFRSAVIDPRDIASVAVAALTEPGHQGKAYPLTGPEALSVAGQVAVIGEVLGREVAFIEQTEAEASADMLSRGMPAQVVESLLAGQRAGLRVAPVVHDTVERVTGRPARRYRDWVTDHAGEFR